MDSKRLTAVRLLAACLAVLIGMPVAVAAPTSSLLRGHEAQLQQNDHGVGIALNVDGTGVGGASGIGYRHYFGNTGLQLNLLPIYYDHGNYIAVYVGGQIINYMLMWSRGRGGSATALRIVLGGNVKVTSDETASIEVVNAANCTTQACKDLQASQAKAKYFASAGAGFGFEFGAIARSGFSVSLDLVMTGLWDDQGFYAAYPLPYGALMYNF